MRRYFGTDGIRGIINQDLTPEIAFKVGNALTVLKKNPSIIIGRDTRQSGDTLSLCVSSGVCAGGGSVIDAGIVPTAGVAYLTKFFNADYGIVISASHNPAEYNGIKVFGSNGRKLNEEEEETIEECFNTPNLVPHPKLGKYNKMENAVDFYINYLIKTCPYDLSGMKIVLDCSNGAAYKVAPESFKKLGAEVFQYYTDSAGLSINNDCGSLFPHKMADKVKSKGADIGFAYDGDSDRLIAADENGEIINGDIILYMLAKYFKSKDMLKKNLAVGTHHTNMGIQNALAEEGIQLLRADIGDKYVMELMLQKDAILGAEQSGHIILENFATTGDGILASIQLCAMMMSEKKKLSEFAKVEQYPQVNINIIVKDKIRVMNNEDLAELIDKCRNDFEGRGRILVRASGTEPKIRIMTEGQPESLARDIAERIAEKVKSI